MKSMFEQEKIIFKRFADCNNGENITVAKVAYLFGKDAAQYAMNAADQKNHRGVDQNVCGLEDVFTFKGFSNAFHYFRMMEIKDGLYNAYETQDYINRQMFL